MLEDTEFVVHLDIKRLTHTHAYTRVLTSNTEIWAPWIYRV